MKRLNQFTSNMPPSGIRHIMNLSKDVKDCIHLEVGQPDFRTPEHILQAAAEAAMEGFTQYTPTAGITELREAIAEKVVKKNDCKISFENVVVSPGAVTSVMSALLAVVEPGDEVLIPDPAWPNYIMQIACVGCKGVSYPLDPSNGFQIDFKILQKNVTPNTKTLIVNTPGNPTGAVFTKESVEKIVNFAKENDLFLISDEIYEDIIFEGEHISSCCYNDDGRIITIFGFSKSYSATGLRIGYSISEKKIANLLSKIQSPLVTCASGISQKACLAALKGPQEPVYEMVKEYKKRRDVVIDILKKNNLYLYTPSGAFYILIDVSLTGMNSLDFAVKLLDEDKVAVAPGQTFGESTTNFIRVCFATNIDELRKGVNILCKKINQNR